MSKALNDHLKPLRQCDLDGLCGVYAILNALQWHLPKARDTDYLTKLFNFFGLGYVLYLLAPDEFIDLAA
jgi:hypothetical protein